MPAESLKTEKPELGRADTSSELLIQLALTRRGITFEMSNLLSFSLHGRWVERIMRARLDAVPASHNLPTMAQLQAADRKLFQVLADQSKAGIQVTVPGRPLDSLFEAETLPAEVAHLPQPLPKASSSGGSEKERPGHYAPPPTPFGGGKGRVKGRKGKNAVRQMKMPAGLDG